jgi:hypothetical protein
MIKPWRDASMPVDAPGIVESLRTDTSTVDACAYLFRACRDLQRTYGDHGIECLFDVEPAKLPATVCDTIVAMVRAVLDDVSRAAHAAGGTVALTLQRRAETYAVVITDHRLRDYGAQPDPDLPSLRLLAARLAGASRIRATADRRVAVVLFDPLAASIPNRRLH